jgi:hypothetical protein
MFEEAVGLLSQTRSRARALRERIRDFNGKHSMNGEHPMRVAFYFGQSLIGREEVDQEESENE